MEFALLFFFFFLFLLSYLFIEKNLLNPTNLYFVGCMFSMFFFMYGNRTWKFEFPEIVMIIYMLGGLCFFLTSLFYKFLHKRYNYLFVLEEPIREIRIRKWFSFLIMFIQIITVVFYYRFLRAHASQTAITAALKYLRLATKSGSIEVPFLLGQMIKLSWVAACIEVYLLIHNVFALKRIKNQAINIIGIASFGVLKILQSERFYLLQIFLEGVFLYVFILQKTRGHKKKLSIKRTLTIGVFSVAFLYAFVVVGEFIGRNTGRFDPLYYVSMYAGSTIGIFSNYVSEGALDISLFGKGTFYTFAGFDRVFGYLGLIHGRLPQTGTFVYVNNHAIGNIVSNYFYWIYDFGILGIIVLSSFMAWVFQSLYYNAKKNFRTGNIHILTLMLGCMIHALVMNCIADYFYRYIISTNYLSMLILVFIIVKIGFRLKISR